MITSLRLFDFKNFADETLCVGPFSLIVGANASGKSNIRDAFRFLHGIGRGYTLAEIIGGKFGAGGQLEWAPIRGAVNEIGRIEKTDGGLPNATRSSFGLEVQLTLEEETAVYTVEASSELFGKDGFRITYERLQLGRESVYEKQRGAYDDPTVVVASGYNVDVALDRPILTQFRHKRRVHSGDSERIEPVIDALSSMRFLDPAPDRMRLPAFLGQTVLGDRGENLPTVLREICADPKSKQNIADWIRELTPMDVRSIEFSDDQSGRVHLKLLESGREISAYSASDGTLRFLVMLAAFLGKNPAGFYFFEEVDVGLHPARLHLLMDLIEKQTSKGNVQLIATTHSADLLSMVNDNTFENTSVICRLEDTDDAIIRPVADLPNAGTLRKTQGLGRLLAGGWMETALAFTEEGKYEGEASE